MHSHFTSFAHFLQMGGYAAYVWPAYSIVFLVLLGNWLMPWRRHQQLKKQLVKNNESAT